jgi:hypothetical protein
MKKHLSTDEVVDRLQAEIDDISVYAEIDIEDAAHWWTRVTGLKAEVNNQTPSVEIGHYEIQRLITSLLQEGLEKTKLDHEQLAELWKQICPYEVHVCKDGLLVEEDE